MIDDQDHDWESDDEPTLRDSGQASSPAASPAAASGPSRIGSRLGHFTIKMVIGSGGMGTVYKAIQEHPKRTVALKVMKAGMASPHALRRFRYEAEVLARLRHPCIAQVYEAGMDVDGEDTPWFAMEYLVGAKTITQYCHDKQLGVEDRLELFEQICDGAHHGHQKGIIHRDLKPGNILVTSQGDPKIIDFGVARSTDSDMAIHTLQTNAGELVGTLQYMSPEQCAADPHDIDSRSDVYALGVVLYQLLTDQVPYNVSGCPVHEAARLVCEQNPAKPSTIIRLIRGDLETVCLKALEKDRDRRYQSALELKQDIRRYLEGEPIAARKPTLTYQLKLLYKRHRAVGILTIALATLLVISTVLLAWLATAQTTALREAERQATRSQALIDGITSLITPPVWEGVQWTVETPWKEVLDHSRLLLDWDTVGTPANATHAMHVAYFRLVLVNAYLNCNAPAEALAVAAETTGELSKWMQPDTPGLLDAQLTEAMALMANGRVSEATTLAMDVLAAKERTLGRKSRDTLGSAWEVAVMLGEAEILDQARAVCEQFIGDPSILMLDQNKQATDLAFVLNLIPVDDRSPLMVEAFALLLASGRLAEIQLLFDLLEDEITATPRAAAALETIDQAEAVVMQFGPRGDMARQWRILRGLALEATGQLDEAVSVLEKQELLDDQTPSLAAMRREALQSILDRIHDRLGVSEIDPQAP